MSLQLQSSSTYSPRSRPSAPITEPVSGPRTNASAVGIVLPKSLAGHDGTTGLTGPSMRQLQRSQTVDRSKRICATVVASSRSNDGKNRVH
jgi:hypothetical protein